MESKQQNDEFPFSTSNSLADFNFENLLSENHPEILNSNYEDLSVDKYTISGVSKFNYSDLQSDISNYKDNDMDLFKSDYLEDNTNGIFCNKTDIMAQNAFENFSNLDNTNELNDTKFIYSPEEFINYNNNDETMNFKALNSFCCDDKRKDCLNTIKNVSGVSFNDELKHLNNTSYKKTTKLRVLNLESSLRSFPTSENCSEVCCYKASKSTSSFLFPPTNFVTSKSDSLNLLPTENDFQNLDDFFDYTKKTMTEDNIDFVSNCVNNNDKNQNKKDETCLVNLNKSHLDKMSTSRSIELIYRDNINNIVEVLPVDTEKRYEQNTQLGLVLKIRVWVTTKDNQTNDIYDKIYRHLVDKVSINGNFSSN